MRVVLQSLPDAKFLSQKPMVTVGGVYTVQGEIGNGYVVESDDGDDKVLILQSRFSEVEQ